MSDIERLIEYYDELYPSDEAQLEFFKNLDTEKKSSPKYLRIGCGTGLLENRLAKMGFDVTGLEPSKPLLNSASLRYKLPNMAVRFFQMSTTEMINFLGKGFYDIIACLNDRIIYLSDENKLQKFFIDCKQLLKKDGKLVIEVTNFSKFITGSDSFTLPPRTSIRSKLEAQAFKTKDGFSITKTLENSSGRKFTIIEKEKVNLITIEKIEKLVKKAGFSSAKLFSDYEKNPFTKDSNNAILVIE